MNRDLRDVRERNVMCVIRDIEAFLFTNNNYCASGVICSSDSQPHVMIEGFLNSVIGKRAKMSQWFNKSKRLMF